MQHVQSQSPAARHMGCAAHLPSAQVVMIDAAEEVGEKCTNHSSDAQSQAAMLRHLARSGSNCPLHTRTPSCHSSER